MGLNRRKAPRGNCCAADPAAAATTSTVRRHEHGEEAGADGPEAAARAARDAAMPHLPLQARQDHRLREARRAAPEHVSLFFVVANVTSHMH